MFIARGAARPAAARRFDRLRALRGPGESFSDVILALAAERTMVVASTSGLGGDRCRAPLGPAIPDEAEACEAEEHHRPS
jgi:hypothetical protein